MSVPVGLSHDPLGTRPDLTATTDFRTLPFHRLFSSSSCNGEPGQAWGGGTHTGLLGALCGMGPWAKEAGSATLSPRSPWHTVCAADPRVASRGPWLGRRAESE